MNDLDVKLDQLAILPDSVNMKAPRVLKLASDLVRLGKFLEPALKFLNCHFTDYYVKSYWTTLLPDNLRLDLEKKSIESVTKCMTDLTTGEWTSYAKTNTSHLEQDSLFNVATLEELIVSVGTLKLSELNACTSFENMQKSRNILKDIVPDLLVDLEFDTFMSSKKMHEVIKFSEIIACSCAGVDVAKNRDVNNSKEKIDNIVDVGSGKGYLSSFLALYYDLKVLAIDASEINTEGCAKRTAKLDKTWPQLVRRAKERQQHGTCTNFGKHWRKKLQKMGITEEEYWATLRKDVNSGQNNLKSVTEMITTKTDLQHLVNSYLYDKPEKKVKYGIIGLHTCGNLGANILKLFLHNENAHFICVVPCCYNLVQEDETLYPETTFYGSKFATESSGTPAKSAPWPDGSVGFPLSSALKTFDDGKPFVVGRNARMLSAYSLPRMIQNETGLEMPPVLYYRAMLQVLLKEHGLISGSEDTTDFRVGRMTKKCSSFKDYVTFAAKKLNISPDIFSEEKIEAVQTKYESPEILDKFHKYYLLRAMFAQVVEDLILLDRIVYLMEQDCIEQVDLVQLFDPALSPRSHAIVASKKVI